MCVPQSALLRKVETAIPCLDKATRWTETRIEELYLLSEFSMGADLERSMDNLIIALIRYRETLLLAKERSVESVFDGLCANPKFLRNLNERVPSLEHLTNVPVDAPALFQSD